MEKLTIIILSSLIFLAWTFLSLNKKKLPNNLVQTDHNLIRNYQYKPNYKKRLVLIIESFPNLDQLLILLRYILKQEIKVDSIILISSDKKLNKVQLIQDTCIVNKVGGLSFLLKESGNNTTILFLFPDGFSAFNDPQFLKQFLETNRKTNGLVKVETDSVNVDVSKIYNN